VSRTFVQAIAGTEMSRPTREVVSLLTARLKNLAPVPVATSTKPESAGVDDRILTGILAGAIIPAVTPPAFIPTKLPDRVRPPPAIVSVKAELEPVVTGVQTVPLQT